MPRRFAVLAIAATLAACGTSGARSDHSAQGPRRSGPCGPATAQTLAGDALARVYRQGSMVYGCSAATGRRTALGQTGFRVGTARLGLVRLAGGYVAFSARSSGVDTGRTTVNVVRLSNGHLITSAPATQHVAVEAFSSAPSLVVRSDGSVAWIGVITSVMHSKGYLEVHKVDRTGAKMLDQGATIVANSLRLRGGHLSWQNGSRTRSAKLR